MVLNGGDAHKILDGKEEDYSMNEGHRGDCS